MRSGGRVTPRRAARRPVNEWSECRDSYDSMKRTPPKSALSSSASRCAGRPPTRAPREFRPAPAGRSSAKCTAGGSCRRCRRLAAPAGAASACLRRRAPGACPPTSPSLLDPAAAGSRGPGAVGRRVGRPPTRHPCAGRGTCQRADKRAAAARGVEERARAAAARALGRAGRAVRVGDALERQVGAAQHAHHHLRARAPTLGPRPAVRATPPWLYEPNAMRNLARGALAGLVPPVRTRPLQSGGCGSPARPPGHAACGRPPRRMHRRRGCSGRPGAPAACPTKPTSQRARARWPGAWSYAASRGTALCRHGTSPESNPPTARLHHPGLCAIRPGERGGAAPGRRPAGRGRRRTAACPRSRACRRSGPAPSAAPARARAGADAATAPGARSRPLGKAAGRTPGSGDAHGGTRLRASVPS